MLTVVFFVADSVYFLSRSASTIAGIWAKLRDTTRALHELGEAQRNQ